MKMPFGKYKGMELRFIDSSYLEWILNDCETDDEELIEVVEE